MYEVDLDGNVVHIKSLEMPESSKKTKAAPGETGPDTPAEAGPDADAMDTTGDATTAAQPEAQPMDVESTISQPAASEPATSVPTDEATAALEDKSIPAVSAADETPAEPAQPEDPWPERFSTTLSSYFSEDSLAALKKMYLEGPEPPFVSDDGWSGRQQKEGADGEPINEPGSSTAAPEPTVEEPATRGRGRGRGGRGARGGRGGRGGGRGGGRSGPRVDPRKVLTDVRLSPCPVLPPVNDHIVRSRLSVQYSRSNQSRHARSCIRRFANCSAESWKARRTRARLTMEMGPGLWSSGPVWRRVAVRTVAEGAGAGADELTGVRAA